jgi:3-oxoacyl-[acyl-carrier-protein] synthase II
LARPTTERRVVITGEGVISALSDSAGGLHDSLCAGTRAIRPLTLFGTDALKCHFGGEIADFSAKAYLGPKNLRSLDRASQMVASAVKLALDSSGWSSEMLVAEEVGLVVGTMFCGLHTISEFDRGALVDGPSYVSPMNFANTVFNAAAGQAAIRHNLRGVNSTVAAGSASGLQAIAYAAELIRHGRARAVLAGGGDAMCFEAILGFDRAGLLDESDHEGHQFAAPFSEGRAGFALGEGAAIVMLEEGDGATARGAHVRAQIRGHSSAYDYSRGTDKENAISAIARVIRMALADANMTATDVGCLSASANGDVFWDRSEAYGVAASLGETAKRLPMTAIKSMLGETLGAGGALQVIDMVETLRDGSLPGICNLEQVEDGLPLGRVGRETQTIVAGSGIVNSIGFDGHCCSLVLSRAGEG